MLPTWLLTALAALPEASWGLAAQDPPKTLNTRRKLHGRFLHVTDLHPDPHYKEGASVSSFCHWNKPKKEDERAGYFGVPFSECDSPWSLTNLTLDFLEKEWAHNVDFVVWTGDSARHDNDNRLPRTPREIYDLNKIISDRMREVFKNVPIVPTIGNNDIWPHNIMTPGPNSITNEYSSMWRSYIPFSSYQDFQRGGYFTVEVIPDHLAVVSLNTIYWYDSNKAVGGCELHQPQDPGNLEFDWLEVQLNRYRERGMQVMLSGHVPPGPGLYFPDCFFRYGQLSLRFQDTIVGHFYGHMNIDHFFFIDVEDLQHEPTSHTFEKTELWVHLLRDFKDFRTKKHLHHNDYTVVNVGPSVIPEYLPSFRVYQYNVTGFNQGHTMTTQKDWVQDKEWNEDDEEEVDDDTLINLHQTQMVMENLVESSDLADDEGEEEGDEDGGKKKKKKGSKRKHGHRHPGRPDCSKKENEDMRACRPWGPRHASAESPSRTNTLWSILGYAQYYLPDIAEGNKTHPPKYKLEYLTWPIENLHAPNDTELAKHWLPPVPKHLLPRSLHNVSRTHSRFVPYSLPDLTIPEWMRMARRLGKAQGTWKHFMNYMYMGAGEETSLVGDEELEEDD